ncbi:MAG: hypothetical protein IT446_08955 [Phycisphaerales bacterium]|nr:hypothetical protein [Phycisphaerales bacterium]
MMERFKTFVRGKVAAVGVGIGTVVTSGMALAQTYTSPLPTELQPTAIITNAANEAKTWIVAGIGIVVGLAFLTAIVKAFTRKATRPVK